VTFSQLWRGRLQKHAQVKQHSIVTLESAVAALASEVASLRHSAESVDLNAGALLNRLDELEKEEDRAIQPGRVIRLTALCAGLLLLAGGVTYFGVKEFANPLAVSSGGSFIVLAVQGPAPPGAPGAQGFPSAGQAYLYAGFVQDDADKAAYQVIVPAKDAGKRYVLLLTGTARIEQLTDDAGAAFPSRLTKCDAPSYQGEAQEAQRQTCQLITGRFASQANGYMPPYRCEDGTSSFPLPPKPNAIETIFKGKPQLATSSSWPYQQYSLPGTDVWSEGSFGNRDSLDNISLDGWYYPATLGGCRADILPKNVEVTDIDTPATQSAGGELFWSSSQDMLAAAFVVRPHDAEEIGNALLATGAATAALAIGFIPVAYEAGRDRRQARKRRRARQGAYSA
jgi:hypothetical protein